MSNTVVIKNCEIVDNDLKDFIIDIAKKSVTLYHIENEIAKYLKDQIEQYQDGIYGKIWHVIVGRSFGSYVTFEKNHYIYFYIGSMAFQIYKTP